MLYAQAKTEQAVSRACERHVHLDHRHIRTNARSSVSVTRTCMRLNEHTCSHASFTRLERAWLLSFVPSSFAFQGHVMRISSLANRYYGVILKSKEEN